MHRIFFICEKIDLKQCGVLVSLIDGSHWGIIAIWYSRVRIDLGDVPRTWSQPTKT